MQKRAVDVSLKEVLHKLRTQDGLEAFGGPVQLGFWRGLWAGLTRFLLHERFFGDFFAVVLGSILSVIILVLLGLEAGARLLLLLMVLGGGVHAWFILHKTAEEPFYTDDNKSWNFEPEPTEEHLGALLNLLTLVRPLADPDTMVHLSWSGGLQPTLLARLSLRDGTPLAVASCMDKQSWESLFLLGDERVSLESLDWVWRFQEWRHNRPLIEERVTRVELSLERHGEQWVDSSDEQPVPDVHARLGEVMAQLLASRMWGEPLYLLRRSPVDLADPTLPREAARMSLELAPSWRAKPRSDRAYLLGLWLGALPWLAVVLVMALVSVDARKHGISLWADSTVHLWLGVTSFLALRLGAILYKQQKLYVTPSPRREAKLAPSTPELSLVGHRLTVGAQSIDLSQPFLLHLYTQQTQPQRPETLLELLPRGGSPQERLRLRVPLRPEGEHGHLPRLESEATFVAPTFFLEHLWPALAGWSQIHGDLLEVDFATHMDVAPGLPLQAQAASVVGAEIGKRRRR